jgi:hypothetical protein
MTPLDVLSPAVRLLERESAVLHQPTNALYKGLGVAGNEHSALFGHAGHAFTDGSADDSRSAARHAFKYFVLNATRGLKRNDYDCCALQIWKHVGH